MIGGWLRGIGGPDSVTICARPLQCATMALALKLKDFRLIEADFFEADVNANGSLDKVPDDDHHIHHN